MEFIKTESLPEIPGLKIEFDRLGKEVKEMRFSTDDGKVLLKLHAGRYCETIEFFVPKPPEKKKVYVVEGIINNGLISINNQFDSESEARSYISQLSMSISDVDGLTTKEIEIEV